MTFYVKIFKVVGLRNQKPVKRLKTGKTCRLLLKTSGFSEPPKNAEILLIKIGTNSQK
jgi:hypothetical protein